MAPLLRVERVVLFGDRSIWEVREMHDATARWCVVLCVPCFSLYTFPSMEKDDCVHTLTPDD